MHKAILYILIWVVIGILVSTASAQDAFEKVVAQIKDLETKLEQNRKLVDQKTREFRKNHKDNAPKDMFESDEMYEKRKDKLNVTVSKHRLELLKQYVEADQIKLARLHREHILSNDVPVVLGPYDANDEFFPITFETLTERFTERLDINRDNARILYENWHKVSKSGYLLVGPAPAHKQILAKVTLEYPEIWRQPITWYFNDSDTMVLIPAGDFEMGSNDQEAYMDEKPVHTVYLDAFYIDKYEVTVGQYKQFVRETEHPAPNWDRISEISPTDQHPIILVNWHDSMAYAQWAGKRLPTEAEWEKAARGGLSGTIYPWGNAAPNGTQCNFYDRSRMDEFSVLHSEDQRNQSTNDGYIWSAPVGNFTANQYGLYDMAGNVWEWCLDEWVHDFYVNAPRRNPIAGWNALDTDNGASRVLRGGSYDNLHRNLRVSVRAELEANRRDMARFHARPAGEVENLRLKDLKPLPGNIQIGFRCVRDVSP